MTDIKNYIDLYDHLQTITQDEFTSFIRYKKEYGNVDRYEASFKLFSYLKLFNKFDKFSVCDGNYNIGNICKNNDIMILLNKSLGGKNDKSDITFINNKTIIASTCKNRDKYTINDLDIRDLSDLYHKNYKANDFVIIFCIIIPDKEYLLKTAHNSEKSSEDIKNIILQDNTIIVDYNDLYDAFNIFKFKFSNIPINKIISLYNTKKKPIIPYLHQKYSVMKTLNLLKESGSILWGHLPRSGKTYIMGCLIYEYSKILEKSNYLIITTSPTETIPEYMKLFNNKLEFDDFNIITKEDIFDKKKPKIADKNIVIVSKQYLQSKTKDTEKTRIIKWLKEMTFNLRFIDESHNGGTTELAKTTLDTYGTRSKTIYMTATYIKPVYSYNIPSDHHILWDLEDNELCKNINNEFHYNKLVNKYGSIMQDTIKDYNINNIIQHYNDIPKLHYITWKLNDDIKNDMIDDDYGFSIQSILMLKNDKKQVIQEFVDENKVEKLVKNIFGYEKKKSYSYYNKNSFLGRIKNIIDKPEYNSRWFSKEKPLVVLAFLPCGLKGMGVADISATLKKLIIKKSLLDDFEIICINSETDTDGKTPKKLIEEAEKKAKIKNKSGILVLTGKKCSLGITIENCDIVLLLTNIDKYDTIFQMLYRCMSVDDNKKQAFVIDLNIQRCINIIMEYAIKISAGQSSKQSLKYILEQKLIEFNVDEWNDNVFGVKNTNIDNIISNVYNIFTSKSSTCIDKILENIDFKIGLFSKDDQLLIKSIFNINKNNKRIKNILDNEDIDVPDGIEKIKCSDNCNEPSDKTKKTKKTEEDIEENVDIFNEIIKKLIPLLALITICYEDATSFDNMINIIKDNENLKPIIMESIITWWGEKVEKEVFNIIIMLYDKYFKDNISFNNKVADIRDIFKHNLGNIKELSKSIDKFLVPHENEKKQNAEISTPYELRKDMLDKMPKDFWNTPKKVFEPCCGKCGFIIDIIDRFMDGLKDFIKDNDERYKFIIEECLYYSDINKTNIFISKLLLNPYNQYKLNYNEGDTLILNIKDKWNIDSFDAVIGNPPYQPYSNGKKGGKSIWPDFVEYAINNLNVNGILLYVHPALWRKPENELRDIMFNKQIHYLSIHNDNDGLKHFNATTRYDYYLIENIIPYKSTKVCFEDENIYDIYINKNVPFIPNFGWSIIEKVMNKLKNNGICVIGDSDCHTSRKHVSKIEKEEFKYKLLNSISKTKGKSYCYSSQPHKNQTKKKVIFSNGRHIVPFYDNGMLGVTQGGLYILVENDDIGNKLVKYLDTKIIKLIIKATKWSNFETNKQVFKYIPNIINEIENIDDNNVYRYFDINEDEIKYIDTYI